MKMLIYDGSQAELRRFFPAENDPCRVICRDDKIHSCIGCGSCWVRSPGLCPIHDDAGLITGRLAETDELYVFSACVYGCVSPFVKTVLDRMIGFTTPILELHNGETRFRPRYEERFRLTVCFYNRVSGEEQRVAVDYIERVGRELNASGTQVFFLDGLEKIREVLP